jgi:uncharacterized repeat protein (TIGR01451 family)
MNRFVRISLISITLLVLCACNLFGPTTVTGTTPVVRLTVQTQNGATTFSQVGDVINYNYVITNTGATPLAGPAIVTDLPRQVTCPDMSTVGNKDNYLDLNETITCTAAYTISQSDINTGSVTNLAIANVGGIASNQTGITLTRSTPSSTLILTKTASSQTYGQAGQTITYNFVITNTGTAALGPAQFTITDNKLGAPFNCGPAQTTLQPNQPINCSATYMITQADMGIATLVNSATASGGGQTSAPATATITNLVPPVAQPTPTPQPLPTVQYSSNCPTAPNLTPGTTIQHCVAVGEWMIQIARCYGVSFTDLRNANPQIVDPSLIFPYPTTGMITVPHIGSAGTVYGPPCVTFITAQSSDTWASIAQRYNADQTVLKLANPGGLVAGKQVRVPRNSAGGAAAPSSPGTSSNNPPSTTPAQRITIDPGQTNAVPRVGVVNPNQTIQYVITAAQGQVLGVKLTATPANEVSIGVNGPTGLALKPLDPTPTWNTTITTGGDYYINIVGALGSSSKTYTLEVSLSPATGAAPAAPTTLAFASMTRTGDSP